MTETAIDSIRAPCNRCKALNKDLKGKLRHLSRNNTRHLQARAALLRESIGKLDGFHKASMSKAVQQSAFWKMPGKVANLVELQSKGAVKVCSTRLTDTHADQEARLIEWWAWMAEQAARRAEQKRLQEELARRTSPPPPRLRTLDGGDHDMNDDGEGGNPSPNRTKAKRAKKRSLRHGHGRRNATASANKIKAKAAAMRQGREECFTVYDD